MKLEQKINQQFSKLADELQISLGEYKEKDWELICKGFAAGLLLPLAPITVPLMTAYAVFGSKHYAETISSLSLAAGFALGPLVLPAMAVNELRNPTTKYYMQLGKENTIVSENQVSLPAVYFNGSPQRITSSVEIYFASGDVGVIPNPDYSKVPDLGNYQRALNKIKYDEATYFLNISAGVNDEMNRLLEERAGRLIK